MVPDILRSIWEEPAAPDPPARTRWDRVLVVGVLLLGLLEAAEPGAPWPFLRLALAAAVAAVLSQRRTRPLRTAVVAVGAHLAGGAALLANGIDQPVASALVLPVVLYALARWASGRHVAIGIALATVAAPVLTAADPDNDAVGALLLWGGPLLLGATVRSRANLTAQRLRDARHAERQRIARELHDSIAHHVSGIAIQAKAARAVAGTDPAVAAAAMATVEEQASQTLTEMRRMVGALRDDDDPRRGPHRSLADIARLAGDGTTGPCVEVELTGELDDLTPSTEAGLFRLAQESITNARRHARHVARVTVRLVGAADAVALTVADDGDPLPAGARLRAGYGLVGMAERAMLLGGTFDAGPGPRRGWIVSATLPKRGPAP